MDDLAILVITFLIATGIFYLIGHPYWWVILFTGAVIFIIGIYITGTYEYGHDTLSDSIAELKKIKNQVNL